jgi:hypothetical protein
MTRPRQQKRYRCRFCGAILLAWYRVPPAPNGAMLLGYLSQFHPDRLGIYLDQMRGSEDIAKVAAQAYEMVEEDEPR